MDDRAASISPAGTRRSSSSTPSNLAVSALTAASPSRRTWARISRTAATGPSPSTWGRGRWGRTSPVTWRRSSRRNIGGWIVLGGLPGKTGDMPLSVAELSSLATAVDELNKRVSKLAEEATGDKRDHIAAELYEIERALTGAQRRLSKLSSPTG